MAARRRRIATFERIHEERYGYAIEDEVIELVSFHVTVAGQPASSATGRPDEFGSMPIARLPRRSISADTDFCQRRSTAVRDSAGNATRWAGMIEEPGSTTLIEPGMSAEVLEDGQLLIDTGAEPRRGRHHRPRSSCTMAMKSIP